MQVESLLKVDFIIDSQAAFIRALAEGYVIQKYFDKSEWREIFWLCGGDYVVNGQPFKFIEFDSTAIKDGAFTAWRVADWKELIHNIRPYLCIVKGNAEGLPDNSLALIYHYEPDNKYPFLATNETVWAEAEPLTDDEIKALMRGL